MNKTQAAAIRHKIRSHLDYGVPNKPAPISDARLAQEVGAARSTVAKLRRGDGILVTVDAQPLPESAISKYINVWKRPIGIQEHLDALADN